MEKQTSLMEQHNLEISKEYKILMEKVMNTLGTML